MIKKIVFQIMDILRQSSLPQESRFELALKILTWAKLSISDTLPSELRISRDLVNDPALAVAILGRLGNSNAKIGQAFADGIKLEQQDALILSKAVDLVMRFVDSGLLVNLDASDVVTAVDMREISELSIPVEVANLLVNVSEGKPDDTAYVPWNSGGQIAARLAHKGMRTYLESPWASPITSLVSLLSPEPFEVCYTDPISAPSAVINGRLKKFNIAVAFPPLGIRYNQKITEQDLFQRFPEHTSSGAIIAVRHLMAQASRLVVIAVQNNLLFGVGAERALREDLLHKKQIEAVIAMPAGLLPYATIGFTVLVLDPRGGHDTVRFVDADTNAFRKFTSKARCQLIHVSSMINEVREQTESEYAISIPVAEILKNDNQLQVSRYVIPSSRKKVQALLATSKNASLESIVHSIRPLPSSADAEMGIQAYEIGAADIPDYGYIAKPGRVVMVDEVAAKKNTAQFLRPFDIVLIVKGTVGKVGIVSPNVPAAGPGGWVAGQSAIVLRIDPNGLLDPRALAMQLRSPLGQELLAGRVAGATIPMIQIRELMRMQVIIPDSTTAEQAIHALDQENQLQEEIEHLRASQKDIASGLWHLQTN
jgi:type I restriction enzyme M protein